MLTNEKFLVVVPKRQSLFQIFWSDRLSRVFFFFEKLHENQEDVTTVKAQEHPYRVFVFEFMISFWGLGFYVLLFPETIGSFELES
jgi:hypothetical protein